MDNQDLLENSRELGNFLDELQDRLEEHTLDIRNVQGELEQFKEDVNDTQ